MAKRLGDVRRTGRSQKADLRICQRGHDVSPDPEPSKGFFIVGPRVTTFLVPKLPLGNASSEAPASHIMA